MITEEKVETPILYVEDEEDDALLLQIGLDRAGVRHPIKVVTDGKQAIDYLAGLGEFGAVITFAANIPGETQTLPLAIYAALQTPDGEAEALRLAVLSFAFAVAGLAFAEALQRWSRRRLAA